MLAQLQQVTDEDWRVAVELAGLGELALALALALALGARMLVERV